MLTLYKTEICQTRKGFQVPPNCKSTDIDQNLSKADVTKFFSDAINSDLDRVYCIFKRDVSFYLKFHTVSHSLYDRNI